MSESKNSKPLPALIHDGILPKPQLLPIESLGDWLIPDLVACLKDEDPEVRRLAVNLLIEARPRSNPAVPALIDCLHDADRLVQIAVLVSIADFGQLAVDAIPHVEPWLTSDNEYLRTLALTTIVILDPTRTELLPDIWTALKDDDFMVRLVAREYFGKVNMTMPFDESAFEEVVRGNWHYIDPGEQVCWRSMQDDDGTWRCEITPVYQEMFGGEYDGKRVWSGLGYHLSGLFREPGMEFDDVGGGSRSQGNTPIPFIGVVGRYFGQPFVLRIGLEPLPDSEIKEVVDMIHQEVRAIPDDDIPF